jgi:hypothetical protein
VVEHATEAFLDLTSSERMATGARVEFALDAAIVAH